MLISIERTGKKTVLAMSGEYGGCASVVTMFFANKSLTKSEQCTGALS